MSATLSSDFLGSHLSPFYKVMTVIVVGITLISGLVCPLGHLVTDPLPDISPLYEPNTFVF